MDENAGSTPVSGSILNTDMDMRDFINASGDHDPVEMLTKSIDDLETALHVGEADGVFLHDLLQRLIQIRSALG